jgi:hypothetical protein
VPGSWRLLDRAERERPPAEPQGWIPHPLLLRRDNHRFEREAEQWHADLRERQRREAEQKNRPHPLVVGPLASIPIPERKSKPKKQAAEPILTTSQQVLLDEAIARASAEPDKRGGRLGHDDAGATSDLCFRSSTRGLFQNTYRIAPALRDSCSTYRRVAGSKLSAEHVAQIPRCEECGEAWLPVDEDRWQASLHD